MDGISLSVRLKVSLTPIGNKGLQLDQPISTTKEEELMWIQITNEQAEAVTKLMSNESLGYSYDLPEEVVAALRALVEKIREARADIKNPAVLWNES